MVRVEVCYALAERAVSREYALPAPACIADALRQAAKDPAFCGIDLDTCAVGIFGQLASPGDPLHEGDRVEVYRPLATDPKTARRRRALASGRRRGS